MAAAAVAKNVLVGTRTSWPPTPSVRRMISSALVPLFTAIACWVLQNQANFCSNSAPYFPSVSWPVLSTSWIRSAIHARSSGINWIFAAGTFLSCPSASSWRAGTFADRRRLCVGFRVCKWSPLLSDCLDLVCFEITGTCLPSERCIHLLDGDQSHPQAYEHRPRPAIRTNRFP